MSKLGIYLENIVEMEEEERLVTCLLCGINTAEAYLKRHIRFNHIINNDSILDYMLQLHQPERNSISVQTTITWITEQTTISKSSFKDLIILQ